MNTTVKLFFTVLVLVFLSACGSGGGSKSQTTSSITTISGYMTQTFPAFDDSLYRDNITQSFRHATFIKVSQNDAESFYDNLINEKDFQVSYGDFDSCVELEPNFDYESHGFNWISANICNAIGDDDLGDYVISLSMSYDGNLSLSESYFDEVFGRPDGDFDFEHLEIRYDGNMTALFNAYYEELKSSGIFAEEECETETQYGETDWYCGHGGIGEGFYHWQGSYYENASYVSFSKGKFLSP
jgi:hypothetical protein